MPTLRFHDSFSATERKILTRTFHQNCRDLGVSKRDASINVGRILIPNPVALGAITCFAKDEFGLILNSKNDFLRSIFCLGHEMVHFDQYTRGDLRDDRFRQLVYWKGKSFPAWMTSSKEHYDTLPWEIEAAEKQDTLMDS